MRVLLNSLVGRSNFVVGVDNYLVGNEIILSLLIFLCVVLVFDVKEINLLLINWYCNTYILSCL